MCLTEMKDLKGTDDCLVLCASVLLSALIFVCQKKSHADVCVLHIQVICFIYLTTVVLLQII